MKDIHSKKEERKKKTKELWMNKVKPKKRHTAHGDKINEKKTG